MTDLPSGAIYNACFLRNRVRENGWLHVVNISSTAPSPTKPQTVVRTVIRGKGDPGYSLAAGTRMCPDHHVAIDADTCGVTVIVSESALALLLDSNRLSDWVRVGGVLTPSTALGDILVQRLETSGRMTFTSEPVLGLDQ